MSQDLKKSHIRGGKRLSTEASSSHRSRSSAAVVDSPATEEKHTPQNEIPVRQQRIQPTAKKSSVSLTAIWHGFQRNLKHSRRQFSYIAREKKANRFPEADNFLIQLVLLVWGMLPALGSKLTETARIRRRRGINSLKITISARSSPVF